MLDKRYLEFEKKIEMKYGKKNFGYFQNMEHNSNTKTFTLIIYGLSATFTVAFLYFLLFESKNMVILIILKILDFTHFCKPIFQVPIFGLDQKPIEFFNRERFE